MTEESQDQPSQKGQEVDGISGESSTNEESAAQEDSAEKAYKDKKVEEFKAVVRYQLRFVRDAYIDEHEEFRNKRWRFSLQKRKYAFTFVSNLIGFECERLDNQFAEQYLSIFPNDTPDHYVKLIADQIEEELLILRKLNQVAVETRAARRFGIGLYGA